MATSAQTSPAVSRTKHAPGTAGRYFYFCMSLVVAAIVIYGFSHTVNPNLIHATPPRPWLLWVHGSLFSGWVAFFTLQSALVRTRNVPLHRLLGWFGAALAASMTVVGLTTAVVMGRFDIGMHESGIPAFLMIPFWDMACFTTLFWLAILWRRKPEIHRRLLLTATCLLTDAAIFRFPVAIAQTWFFAGADLLIVAGVVRDLIVIRRVHPAYTYALLFLIPGQLFVMYTWLTSAHWWIRIANAILG